MSAAATPQPSASGQTKEMKMRWLSCSPTMAVIRLGTSSLVTRPYIGDTEDRTVTVQDSYSNMKGDMTNERSSLILCLLVMFLSF